MLRTLSAAVLAFTLAEPAPDDSRAERRAKYEQAIFAPTDSAAVTAGEVPFDFDGDSDIDRHDYFAFQICHSFSGPELMVPPACGVFDADLDGDIDLVDFSAFLEAFTGTLSQILVEAGELVPIMPATQMYYSGEPGSHGNNALHGVGRQAGFSQDDLWYEWKLVDQPAGSGQGIIANAAEASTAFRLQPDVLAGNYIFQLTVTNLFTFEVGSDDVFLDVAPCQNDLDCDDGLFCTAHDVCDLDSTAAEIDGCVHYGSPCKCTASGIPCHSDLGDRQVCKEVERSCLACTLDAECDDEIACTNDTCLSGVCVAAPVHGRCPQGLFCDKQLGCVPPP